MSAKARGRNTVNRHMGSTELLESWLSSKYQPCLKCRQVLAIEVCQWSVFSEQRRFLLIPDLSCLKVITPCSGSAKMSTRGKHKDSVSCGTISLLCYQLVVDGLVKPNFFVGCELATSATLSSYFLMRQA